MGVNLTLIIRSSAVLDLESLMSLLTHLQTVGLWHAIRASNKHVLLVFFASLMLDAGAENFFCHCYVAIFYTSLLSDLRLMASDCSKLIQNAYRDQRGRSKHRESTHVDLFLLRSVTLTHLH